MSTGDLRVSQFIDSLRIGGAEVVALNLASGLKKRGHECAVWGMSCQGELAERLALEGIEGASFDCPAGVSLKTMARVVALLRRQGIQAIITHHFRQLVHALPAAFLLGVKVIHVEHDTHFYEADQAALKRLRHLSRFVEAFVGVSEEITEWYSKHLHQAPGLFKTIHNGVDTDRFKHDNAARQAQRARYDLPAEAFVVGTCARLEPVKNLDLLLEGFAINMRGDSLARLIVVGAGSRLKALVRLAERLGIAEQVLFVGMQSAIEDYLNLFDVYALTSSHEGLPMSVLEAMAVGLPIVATDVGSLARIAGSENAILLDEATPACLSAALGRLRGDPARRSAMGGASRQLVQAGFSVEVMVDRYEELIRTALN